MNQPKSIFFQLAEHLENVYFGGNWSSSSLYEHLNGLSIEQAYWTDGQHNDILTLTYHIHYYIRTLIRVMDKGILDSKDALSFDHPQIGSQRQLDQFLDNIWKEARTCVLLMRDQDDEKLKVAFVQDQYGNYLSNIMGIIEHVHYHLGQIVLLKKLQN